MPDENPSLQLLLPRDGRAARRPCMA